MKKHCQVLFPIVLCLIRHCCLFSRVFWWTLLNYGINATCGGFCLKQNYRRGRSPKRSGVIFKVSEKTLFFGWQSGLLLKSPNAMKPGFTGIVLVSETSQQKWFSSKSEVDLNKFPQWNGGKCEKQQNGASDFKSVGFLRQFDEALACF